VNTEIGRRYFFVHIMKTGGATFRQHVYRNFPPGAVYPVPQVDDMERAWLIPTVVGLPPERREALVAYTGHLPLVVAELLGLEFVTMTLLRDPVERTVSYLKHCKRYHEHHRDLPLEAIYEDEFYFRCFVHNHQTKMFAMDANDPLESYMDVVAIDDARLRRACDELERVDVLGLSERQPQFRAELERRFGWRFGRLRNRRVSDEPWEASPALRRRIAHDNAADLEFYAHAVRCHERRERSGRDS
jgi:hypothetical protein